MRRARRSLPPEYELPGGPGFGRSNRALGRGLEDISHLFLSVPPPEQPVARCREQPVLATREEPATLPRKQPGNVAAEQQATPPQSRPRAGLGVLRPGLELTRLQLTATLLECGDALEQGMHALGIAVSCSPYGTIDVIAVDRYNQLTVIDVDTAVGDGLLARGISHVDWATRNMTTVQRMFEKWEIDASGPLRLALVAPTFSPLVLGALRQINGPHITCFRYLTTTTSGGTAVLFEQVCDLDQ
jgi:hypothetical protein